MGSLFSLTLQINLLALLSFFSWNVVDGQGFNAAPAHLLDHVVRDHAFLSYTGVHRKTGSLYLVHLPENFSGIEADTVRFRCGSLRRYGAKIKEFSLAIGVTVRPCVERVVVVRQNLGNNWSSIYYDTYNFSGYQLVSPVLGLLAYNADDDLNSTNRSEIGIFSGEGERPIMIDFSMVVRVKASDLASDLDPLCASFNSDGTVSLWEQVSSNICVAPRDGHFALVIAPSLPKGRGRVSRWKVLVGSIIGGALGVSLLFLLFIALVVKVKKRSRIAEMERRAYEEEALQMSMVGHVRAPTAAVTRTLPTLEQGYTPP